VRDYTSICGRADARAALTCLLGMTVAFDSVFSESHPLNLGVGSEDVCGNGPTEIFPGFELRPLRRRRVGCPAFQWRKRN
jgi:hypothetical protein